MTKPSQDDQDRLEREREQTKETPRDSEETAASKFRQEVAAKIPDSDEHDAEENLWSGGYSPKAMVGTWILMAVISVVLLVLPFVVAQFAFPIALGVILLMWVFGGLQYVWRRLGVHYQLTSQRFIHQAGIMTRHTDRIEVIDIDDVSFSQGPVQRLFGVGSIQLTSRDRTHPTLSMPGIGEVRQVAGLIDDIRRKERRRRSLHIEAI